LRRRVLFLTLLISLPPVAVSAQSTDDAAAVIAAAGPGIQATTGGSEPSVYDKIWRFAEWYENDTNPVVQRVLFSGRYQHEYATLDADQGDHDEWNIRRMRLGSRVTLFRRFTLHGEADLNPQESDPFYVRLTDFYLEWSRSDRLVLTLGKQGVPFTMDGSTSSKELLAIDRSNLTNNMWFPDEYAPGFSASGSRARWVYHGGVYSAGAENREFGEFSAGVFTLGVIGYDFAQSLGVREALLAGNYVYQHPASGTDLDDTFTRPLDHVASINFKLDAGGWGLRTDFSVASGLSDQSDLWGVMAMPFVNLTDKLQLVGRYTYLKSEKENGVRLATYESRVVSGRGDEYHEAYGGANYYFYGHKLKVQTGVQFADMADRAADGGEYSGVSWVSGVRVGW
jgi:phosphate-selective porin OprO and OprP